MSYYTKFIHEATGVTDKVELALIEDGMRDLTPRGTLDSCSLNDIGELALIAMENLREWREAAPDEVKRYAEMMHFC